MAVAASWRTVCAMTKTIFLTSVVAALAASLPGGPVRAQSAEQYNRATQAMQICGSSTGALIPECAKFRGSLGMTVVSPQDTAAALGQLGLRGNGAPAGLGGSGQAAGIANLLGAAISAGQNRQAPLAAAPPPPPVDPAAIQQAVSACVRGAGGNAAVIQTCLQIGAAGPTTPAARPATNPFGTLLPTRQ